jgi:hypothetical protein
MPEFRADAVSDRAATKAARAQMKSARSAQKVERRARKEERHAIKVFRATIKQIERERPDRLIGSLDVTAVQGADDSWSQAVLRHGWYVEGMRQYPVDQKLFNDVAALVRDYCYRGTARPRHS